MGNASTPGPSGNFGFSSQLDEGTSALTSSPVPGASGVSSWTGWAGSSAAGISKVLNVPYFSQPTGNTCQSTVLKMMAVYLDGGSDQTSTGPVNLAIEDIWKHINEDAGRPSKERNAHANMKWWLEQRFPGHSFEYVTTKDEDKALQSTVRFINAGFPVLMSVSHTRVKGHILLVVGYANYSPQTCSAEPVLVVHDPYGEFDPTLKSRYYGKNRWIGGMSLMGGGEAAVGRGVRLPISAVSRRRPGDHAFGNFYLLSASR